MIAAIRTFSLAAASGILFFFTFVVTGNSFDVLGQSTAAELLDRLFPVYYRLQLVLLGIPWVLLLVRRLSSNRSLVGFGYYGRRATDKKQAAKGLFILLSFLLILVLAAAFFLLPRVEEIREAMGPAFAAEGTPLREEWGRLHGISMGLNGVVLAGTIIAAFLSAVTL